MDDLAGEELERFYLERMREDYEEYKAREQECGVYLDCGGDVTEDESLLQVGSNHFVHSIDYHFGLRVVCHRVVASNIRAIAHYSWIGRGSLVGQSEKGIVSLDLFHWTSDLALFRYAERIANYRRQKVKNGN